MVVAMPRQVQILTSTAIGDAYGVCFEYAPREIIRTRNNLVGYFRHHKYQTGGGRYSEHADEHCGGGGFAEAR